ncbi:hypothetical protein [Salinithrix halophila]|uniref:Uncharacterized protein n=1 Tax=Salinithrix halophila TaxID=1485204 RepID=A0ABV8JFX6_9BACL
MSARDDWEEALDEIDWNQILKEVDGELLENLALELRFSTYEALKQSSLSLGEGYYLTHLSDGRLAFWHEKRYVEEDVRFFETGQLFLHYAMETFQLQGESIDELARMIGESYPLKTCSYCGMHFDPNDPARQELGIEGIFAEEDGSGEEFCAPQCAVEAMVQEMKEG